MLTNFVICACSVIFLIYLTDNRVSGSPRDLRHHFKSIQTDVEKNLPLVRLKRQSTGPGETRPNEYKASSFSEQSKAGAVVKHSDGDAGEPRYEKIGESEPIVSRNTSSSYHECTETKYDPNRFPPYYTIDCSEEALGKIQNSPPRPNLSSATSGLPRPGFGPPPVPFDNYRNTNRFTNNNGPYPVYPPHNTDNSDIEREHFLRQASRNYQNYLRRNEIPQPLPYSNGNSAYPGFSSVNTGFGPVNTGFSPVNPGFNSRSPTFGSFPNTDNFNSHYSEQSYQSSQLSPDIGQHLNYQLHNGAPFPLYAN